MLSAKFFDQAVMGEAAHQLRQGEVTEWSKVRDWKSRVP